MQNREAAQYVTEKLLAVVDIVTTSVKQIDAMNLEGKVSSEEAGLYRQNVMGPLDEMLTSNLSVIFERYPDLRPKCPCADSPQEDEQQRS